MTTPPQQPPASVPPGFGPPQPPTGTPEFLAVDADNSIVVDVAGVAFEDHGAAVEFSWPEIQSVHYKASPNGKALMMAVVLPNGQFYECVVQAKPRTQLAQWFAQLAPVLGYYRPLGW